MEYHPDTKIAGHEPSGKTLICTKKDWRANALPRCMALSERLQSEEFEFGPYNTFKVYEPKERDVLAINFAGKVAQHAICDNLFYPAVARGLVASNSAVQVGKGTQYALNLLVKQMRHLFMSNKQADNELRRAQGLPLRPQNEWDYTNGWVYYGDIHKYFDNMRHDRILDKCEWALRDTEEPLRTHALHLLEKIISSTPGEVGIPIGNQTSQLFGILYLGMLDHIIVDDLGLTYGRYMDDFYIIERDKERLREAVAIINEQCGLVGLELNSTSQMHPVARGIDFLGWRMHLTQTGKVVKKVKKKTIWNRKRKIRKQRELYDAGEIAEESIRQSYESWRGHIKWGDTYHLEREMTAYFHTYFPDIVLKGEQGYDDIRRASRRQQSEVRRVWRRTHHLDCRRS